MAAQFDEISDFDARPVRAFALFAPCISIYLHIRRHAHHSFHSHPPHPTQQVSYPTSNNDAFGEIMSNLENQKAAPAPAAVAAASAAPAGAAAPLFELMEKVR